MNIKVNITGKPFTGRKVTFPAPCDCASVTDGLSINGEIYAICDAMGKCVTGIDGKWAAGAQVSVILDCENKKAYIQNAAGGGGGYETFTADTEPATRSKGKLYGLILADYREVE